MKTFKRGTTVRVLSGTQSNLRAGTRAVVQRRHAGDRRYVIVKSRGRNARLHVINRKYLAKAS